jgi:hypothetical protein
MNLELKHVEKALADGQFVETDEGLLVPHKGVVVRGKYTDYINGEKVGETFNLVPAEGIAYFLNTGMKGGTAITSWYLALFSANVSPAANWTAANFVANATEVVSGTEGYSQATRVAWTGGSVSGGKVGNAASPARFTIVCTSTLNVAGAALLSASAKGAVTGTLASATRYTNVRTLGNGDQYDLVYELELIDS